MEQKELWVPCRSTLRSPRRHRKPKGQEEILEDPDKALDGLPFHFAFARDVAAVNTDVCEKLIASKNREKLPMLRTSPSCCTSSFR